MNFTLAKHPLLPVQEKFSQPFSYQAKLLERTLSFLYFQDLWYAYTLDRRYSSVLREAKHRLLLEQVNILPSYIEIDNNGLLSNPKSIISCNSSIQSAATVIKEAHHTFKAFFEKNFKSDSVQNDILDPIPPCLRARSKMPSYPYAVSSPSKNAIKKKNLSTTLKKHKKSIQVKKPATKQHKKSFSQSFFNQRYVAKLSLSTAYFKKNNFSESLCLFSRVNQTKQEDMVLTVSPSTLKDDFLVKLSFLNAWHLALIHPIESSWMHKLQKKEKGVNFKEEAFKSNKDTKRAKINFLTPFHLKVIQDN